MSSEQDRELLELVKSYVVVSNAMKDPSYAPYCMRCIGLVRMKKVEPMLWRHSCGAVHDERQVLRAAALAKGEGKV